MSKKTKGHKEKKNTSSKETEQSQEEKQELEIFEDYDDAEDETNKIIEISNNIDETARNIMQISNQTKNTNEYSTGELTKLLLNEPEVEFTNYIENISPEQEFNSDIVATTKDQLIEKYPELGDILPNPPYISEDEYIGKTGIHTNIVSEFKKIRKKIGCFAFRRKMCKEFINYIAALALSVFIDPYLNIPVYPSVTIIQAINESDCGSEKKNKTMFGQKAFHKKRPFDLHETTTKYEAIGTSTNEEKNGRLVKVNNAKFTYAADDYESVQNYARMLQRYTRTFANIKSDKVTTLDILIRINNAGYSSIKKDVSDGVILKGSYMNRLINTSVGYFKLIKSFDNMDLAQIKKHIEDTATYNYVDKLLSHGVIYKVKCPEHETIKKT